MKRESKTELTFNSIIEHYKEELLKVEEELLTFFRSDVPLLPVIGKYIIEGGGKRIRPLFLLISAELSGFKGEERIKLAAIIESIHTASLLHDDVIDNARMRRGKTAAHHIWGNRMVILAGDYLYSNALKEAVSLGNQEIMEVLSEATASMTEGELFQLNRIGDPEITEEEYIKIVSAKTGALISSACRIGGILGNLPEKQKEALSRFGMEVGIAFQVSDDILDYISDENQFGKNLGKDIEEGKITLPIIYLLQKADKKEIEQIIKIIKEGPQDGDLLWLRERLKEYKSIESAMDKARAIIRDAKRFLSIFPDSIARDELFYLADYSIMRKA